MHSCHCYKREQPINIYTIFVCYPGSVFLHILYRRPKNSRQDSFRYSWVYSDDRCSKTSSKNRSTNRLDRPRFDNRVSNALGPTSDHFEYASQQLTTEPKHFLNQVFNVVDECRHNQQNAYPFNDESKRLLKNKKDAFIAKVNETIQDGSAIPLKKTHGFGSTCCSGTLAFTGILQSLYL